MSHEGVTLLARTGLVICLIIVSTVFRYLIGRGRRRSSYMLAGTLGGMSFGVFVASLISSGFKIDLSAICVTAGMVLGWTVAWLFARRVPADGV